MKKMFVLGIILLIVLLSVKSYIIKDFTLKRQSAKFELIVKTKGNLDTNTVEKIITDNLKKLDPKIKIDVKESSSEVVKLEDIYVVKIETYLDDKIIVNELKKDQNFQYVQLNLDFKSLSKP